MLDELGRKVIVVPKIELWNQSEQQFEHIEETKLVLEHSLYTIARWESKWKTPFLSRAEKTTEQLRDYIRLMNTTDVNPRIYDYIPASIIREIYSYIEDGMTATFFSDKKGSRPDRRPMTSELIYYWMIYLGVPFECQHWHMNRLLTLIKVCQEESKTRSMQKNVSGSAITDRRALNKLRQARMKG